MAIDHDKDLLSSAREAEAARNYSEAEKYYKQLIKLHPFTETAYDRLFIIYRKQKKSVEERALLIKAIKTFSDRYEKRSNRASRNSKVSKLSKSLLKSTGLLSPDYEYHPEPINRWTKRLNRMK